MKQISLTLATLAGALTLAGGAAREVNPADTFSVYGVQHGCVKTNICVVPGSPIASDPLISTTTYRKRAGVTYAALTCYTNDGTGVLNLYTSGPPASISLLNTNLAGPASVTNLIFGSSNFCVSGDQVLIYDGWLDTYHWAVADVWHTNGPPGGTSYRWLKLKANTVLTNASSGSGTMQQVKPGQNSGAWKLGLVGQIPLSTALNTFAPASGYLLSSPQPNLPLVLSVTTGTAAPLYADALYTNRIRYVTGAYR